MPMKISRYRLQNVLMLFVAVGVLFRLGSQIRQIIRGASGEPSAQEVSAALPTAAPRDQAPRALGTVTGTVIRQGRPAALASVLVLGPTERRARADAEGRFWISGLRPGVYRLAALEPPLASAVTSPLVLSEGEARHGLSLVLKPGAPASGAVVDEASGEPIPGARISMAGQEAVCDARGHFHFPGLPAASMPARVSAEGFVPRRLVLTPPEASLVIGLERGVPVSGRAADEEGRPVPGAAVTARRWSPLNLLPAEEPVPVAVTDVDGRYSGLAPKGVVTIAAESGEGGAAASSARERRKTGLLGRSGLLLLRAGDLAHADVTLFPAGLLAGKVSLLSGADARGCRIQIEDAVLGTVIASEKADGEGSFWVEGLPRGVPLALRARCLDGRADLGGLSAVPPADAETARTQLILGSGSVAGRVVDGRGRPVPGALVDAAPMGLGGGFGERPDDGPGGGFWQTDGEGRFRVTGLSGDTFCLWASSRSGGRAHLCHVPSGSDDVVLTLSDSGVFGRLLAADGSPVKEGAAAAVPLAFGPAHAVRFASSDGTFRLPLVPGSYRFWAASSGPAGRRAGPPHQEITVSADTWMRLDVRLPKPASLSGTVRAAPTGERERPVAGALELTMAPAGASERRTEGSDAHDADVPPDAASLVTQGYAGLKAAAAPGGGELRAVSLPLFGPAHSAGIREGDVLVAIDGIQVGDWDADRAQAALSGPPGTQVAVTVRRSSLPADLTVHLQRVPVLPDELGGE